MNMNLKAHLTPLVEARLRELDEERATLLNEFPHLRERSPTPPKESRTTEPKRRKMSAAARRAISAAQKARWAKQKKT